MLAERHCPWTDCYWVFEKMLKLYYIVFLTIGEEISVGPIETSLSNYPTAPGVEPWRKCWGHITGNQWHVSIPLLVVSLEAKFLWGRLQDHLLYRCKRCIQRDVGSAKIGSCVGRCVVTLAVTFIQRVVLTVLNSFSRQSFLVSTNVTSTLEVFIKWYALYKFTFYLLTFTYLAVVAVLSIFSTFSSIDIVSIRY